MLSIVALEPSSWSWPLFSLLKFKIRTGYTYNTLGKLRFRSAKLYFVFSAG